MKQKILITGTTGFIGDNLIPRLTKKYEVHTLERYVTGRYTLDKQDIITHYANLTDYNKVRQIVKEVQAEYVIHLGAISAVSFSYDHNIEVSEVNYLGSINLAEACRELVQGFKQFIFAGTSEEYGMTLQNPRQKLTETSPLQPNSPYAVSKVAVDNYLQYMDMAYQFPYTIMRPFNTYGRLQNNHFLVERVMTQMLQGNKVYLGDPDAIRDWLFVDDHVNGYLKALGNPKAINQTFNLCTGTGYTIRETAEIIAEATNFKGEIIWHTTPPRPLDAKILIGDNSKAKKYLGWKPKWDFKGGIKMMLEIYRMAGR